MKLNFRQGLLSFQRNSASAPLFLTQSSTSGYIDLNVAPTPLVATIAHLSSDYLLTFAASVPAAFGPLVSGVDNHLFVEVDVITGETRFGLTTLEPIVSSVEPTGVMPGQTWFDLNTTQTLVRNNANTKFIPAPRVFLGKVIGGNANSLVPRDVGTQVGLNVPGYPGYFMLDEQLRPLRTSTGALLTTDTPVRVKTTQGSAGVLTTPLSAFIPVRAAEAIPAMRLVYFVGEDAVALASSNPALVEARTPVGLVQLPLAQNEVGVITQTGEITYDQWNWPEASFGKPLYSGDNGELTTQRPQSLQAFRVGFIKNAKTILFGIDAETTPQVYSAPGDIIHGEAPIVAVTGENSIGENVTTISIAAAAPGVNGYMTGEQATALEAFDGRVASAEEAIVELETSKANVQHAHVAADITDLQPLLDAKLGVDANFDDRYAPININFDGVYAPAVHTHTIAQVDFLQDALNDKAPTVHTHVIADVTDLQTTLDGKAPTVHTHQISQVTGLQTALDGKAPSFHTHTFDQVPGLQAALDSKAAVNHTQEIASINGLQAALNSKADAGQTFSFSSLTDVDQNLELIDGHVVTYNDTLGKFTTAPAGGAAATMLGELTDVLLETPPAEHSVLAFNGTAWDAKAPFTVNGPDAVDYLPTSKLSFVGSTVAVTEPGLGQVQVEIGAPDLSNYLELDGGTMTGWLFADGQTITAETLRAQIITTMNPDRSYEDDVKEGFVEIRNNSWTDDLTGRIEFLSEDGYIRANIGSVNESFHMRYVATSHDFDGDLAIGDGEFANGKGTFAPMMKFFGDGSIMVNGADFGVAGQVLTSAGPNTPVTWTDLPEVTGNYVPYAGVDGQILSSNQGFPVWIDQPSELPEGGTLNQVLTLDNAGTPIWADAQSDLPTIGTEGQVLTINTGAPVWQTLPESWSPPALTAEGDVLRIGAGNTIEWWAPDFFKLPLNPQVDQVLAFNGTSTVWTTLPEPFSLPTGTTGQVFTIDEVGEPVWADVPEPFSLPPGMSGQVLMLDEAVNPFWSDMPQELPPPGADGQVLTTSGGYPSWSDLPTPTPVAMTIINTDDATYAIDGATPLNALVRATTDVETTFTLETTAAIGFSVLFSHAGSGVVHITAGTGAVVLNAATVDMNGTFSKVRAIKVSATEWELDGDYSLPG